MLFWFVALWLVLGAAAVLVMRRRGHDTFAWALLFVLLGPLAIPVAVSSDRHRPAQPDGAPRGGSLDVLVAALGDGDIAEIRLALAVLDPSRVTSLTLAAVVDIEAASTVRGHDAQRTIAARLEAHAADLARWTDAPIDTVILYGNPNVVLQSFAAEHGYELIVTRSGSHRRVPVLLGAELA